METPERDLGMKNGLHIDIMKNKIWYLNDRIHREDGPAIETETGYFTWCKNGEKHREDGPAHIEPDGTKWWYLHGKIHRIDGPALEDVYGNDQWFIGGICLNEYEIDKTKKFLAGECFRELPMYLNHPILKFVAKKMLEQNE